MSSQHQHLMDRVKRRGELGGERTAAEEPGE